MFKLFNTPKKEHPVEKAVNEKIAQLMPAAIIAYDEADEQTDSIVDNIRISAEQKRKEIVAKAYADEDEAIGQALSVAASKKDAALKAAVDQIFCS